MARKKKRKNPEEERMLREFVENVAAREPRVKIYRKESNNEQTPITTMTLDAFSEEELREGFGHATYFLRTVRSNGTFGPSCVIRIAPRPRQYR